MFIVILVVTNTCMQVHVSGQPDKICPATREEEVKSFDVRISKTKVPVEATYYVCQQFEVPHAAAYHAVAFEPIIDNKRVMHHMILYACDNDVAVQEGPHKCEENDLKCEKWLATWTLGLEGQICTHQNSGVRFGRGSVQRMALQVHWANTELNTGYFDSSGMSIFYTPKLRQYDLGNVQIGQTFLEIPPLSDRFEQHGSCSSDCSRKQLLHPVYFTKTNLHMHGAGVAGSLEQYRGGRLLNLIAYDPFYDNLKPHIHEHNPPIEVLPGDEIVLRCLYDTLSPEKMRVNTTSFGLGSDDEMCYAFVSHFPALPHFDRCIQYQDLDAGDCAPTTLNHTFTNLSMSFFKFQKGGLEIAT
ncbi:DBH-like monooxygenase protein 1 [Lingula anatina]|uniref:DBH-like monooxygenase protein 1 n=1 Tax=Lingula anatina TaxID=7574 RepID=A0A1S3IW66_LINAN|nr:DBH-like monooxygenase protein 1 [Lingula anatina]|eukprot:XP_013401794.2 DBH-like monooxygenase protein 1 [Lingula anatina]